MTLVADYPAAAVCRALALPRGSFYRRRRADDDRPVREALSRLAGRPAIAFCGLGNPDAFRRTLAGLGVELAAFRTFPDHHAYTRADVEGLRGWAGRLPAGCVILTTQKDLVKLRLERLGGRDLWALRVQLLVEAGRDVLDRKLHEVMRTRY